MNIQAVIVTYNPDSLMLIECIESLQSQVGRIYLINNSDTIKINLEQYRTVCIINLKKNYGVAYAQNLGLKESIKDGAEFTLLSDQDTLFPKNYVFSMLKSTFEDNEEAIAIAPLFKDVNTQKPNTGFVFKTKFGFKTKFPKSGLHEINQAISSGLIIKNKLVSHVGLMKEDLFIDWVDIEWCWRAIKKGYKVIGNANVIISHKLGDKSLNLGFRTVSLRNPIRNYYITRNSFYLASYCQDIDFLHRITLFFKSFRYLFFFPIVSGNYCENLKLQFKALKDGLLIKLGPFH